MIKSIEIKNFQSHKDTKLDFLPGVNIIVGTSDSGKTVIIRALKWVAKNRPSGDAFRSNWGGDTEVVLKVDDTKVIRRRTKTKNEYQIEEMVLKVPKTDVPKEVEDVLNIDEINLQGQFDSSFLLSATSGEVANHFNKIANFEKIGQTIQTIRLDLLQYNRDLGFSKERLIELREGIKEFEYIPDFEKDLVIVEVSLKRFKQLENELDALQSFKEKLQEIQGERPVLVNLIDLEEQVSVLLLNTKTAD